jgi:hypothetical protein
MMIVSWSDIEARADIINCLLTQFLFGDMLAYMSACHLMERGWDLMDEAARQGLPGAGANWPLPAR